MFSFWKRKERFSFNFEGFVDRHCHLLYGVDDGAKSVDESQSMINSMKELGFKGAWCTPHIKSLFHKNTHESLRERFEEAKSTLDIEGFELNLAAEYMMDSELLSRIDQSTPLVFENNRMLVEFSGLGLLRGWHDILFEIKMRGYTPILAHPERYHHFLSFEELKELHDEGCELQLNLPSMFGRYGKEVKKLAESLYQSRLYDYYGTDAHNASMIRTYLNEK